MDTNTVITPRVMVILLLFFFVSLSTQIQVLAQNVMIEREPDYINVSPGGIVNAILNYSTNSIVGMIITENLPPDWGIANLSPDYDKYDADGFKWLLMNKTSVGNGSISYKFLIPEWTSPGIYRINSSWKCIDADGNRHEGWHASDFIVSSPSEEEESQANQQSGDKESEKTSEAEDETEKPVETTESAPQGNETITEDEKFNGEPENFTSTQNGAEGNILVGYLTYLAKNPALIAIGIIIITALAAAFFLKRKRQL